MNSANKLGKHLSVRLPQSSFEQLLIIAQFNRVSPSELLRLIVEDWLVKRTGRTDRIRSVDDVRVPPRSEQTGLESA